ncbi:MAG: hypothetical protein HY878_06050 [Deltaproteobacteria bacterium]|nr:hypothetical protein [Deltaproteobacteria bacterium]
MIFDFYVSPSFASETLHPASYTLKRHPSPVFSPGPGKVWDSEEVEPSAVIREDGVYKMWYTGSDGKTDRIGYAASRNGIEWEKHPLPILDTGHKDTWDSFGVAYPSVIRDGDVYKMWYSGGDERRFAIGYATSRDGLKWTKHPEPLLSKGLGLVDLAYPWVIKDGDIYRMWYVGRRGDTYRIGYAVSRDGVRWEVKDGGLVPGKGWDRYAVLHPMVLKGPLSGQYIIFYSGKGEPREGLRIGYALSKDGVRWERGESPVLEEGMGWDVVGVYRPVALWDEHHYILWFAGGDGRRIRVGMAFSEEGKTWHKYGRNPVLDTTEGRSWMDTSVYRGTVIKEDGLYRMWFSGFNGTRVRIGHATSNDGINWGRSPLGPVMEPDEKGWNRFGVAYPSVVKDSGVYKMWYAGYDGLRHKIGYATSRDGIHWEKYPEPVVDLGEDGSWDGVTILYPFVIKDGSGYKLYYAGFDGKTQRIGLATSLDGVHWKRSPENPVLDVRGGLLGVSYPWVIRDEDGLYRMWYSGLTEGGYRVFLAESKDGVTWEDRYSSPLLSLVKTRDAQETRGPMVLNEEGFYRMWYEEFDNNATRIAHAISEDGVEWGVYEDSTVLDPGAGDGWDSYGVAGGWVIKEEGVYKMWYAGHDGSTYRIGYATSRDGINWERYKENPLVDVGPKGSWDGGRVAYPMVIKERNLYRMWYHGFSRVSPPSIGHATSTDGIHWEKTPGPLLTPGETGSWDGHSIGYPMVIKDGGIYRMWYAGLDNEFGNWRIGYAESKDGLSWVKFLNPVVDLGERGDWDDFAVSYPMVLKQNSMFLMWYGGIDGGSLRIGLATSRDGIVWEGFEDNPVLDIGDEGGWDEASVFAPRVLVEGDTYRIWYAGFDRTRVYRIGYAEYFDKGR